MRASIVLTCLHVKVGALAVYARGKLTSDPLLVYEEQRGLLMRPHAILQPSKVNGAVAFMTYRSVQIAASVDEVIVSVPFKLTLREDKYPIV